MNVREGHMLDGTSKCAKCGLAMIEEEREAHVCQKKPIDYRVEGNKFYYFDGFKWWKHILRTVSTETLQEKKRDKSTDDLPAPA